MSGGQGRQSEARAMRGGLLVAVASWVASATTITPAGIHADFTETTPPPPTTTTTTTTTTSRPTTSTSTTAAVVRATTPRGPLPGSVTCATVEQLGSAASLPAASLRALQPQQAAACVALLGKDPLDPEQARAVWDGLLQAYESADMVPEDTLRLLGWVSTGIPPDHLANLTLGEIDTVATLGRFHNLSLDQLTALAESVHFQWSAKEPEDLSYVDLAALNHILCGFNTSDLARVHADAYKEAASSLSLLRCPGTPGTVAVPGDATTTTLPQLAALASLAESDDAFGDPARWGPATVAAVGCVLVGLSNTSVARIPSASLHGMLQALAAGERPVIQRCLYGTPSLAQRLSSTDQQVALTTISPFVTSTVSNSTSSVAATASPPENKTLVPPDGSAAPRRRDGRSASASPAASLSLSFLVAFCSYGPHFHVQAF